MSTGGGKSFTYDAWPQEKLTLKFSQGYFCIKIQHIADKNLNILENRENCLYFV